MSLLFSDENNQNVTDRWNFPDIVRYVSPEERNKYKLSFKDGKIFDIEGNLFDTFDAVTIHTGNGRAIFVMDAEGNFYASKYHKTGEFHHSSLLAGQPVAAAGELGVREGVLEVISNLSTHYRPGHSYIQQAFDSLEKQGIDLANVERHLKDWIDV